MEWFLLIGLFCVLAVIGFFVTGRPFRFALGGIVVLVAIGFVLFMTVIIWALASPCTAPFSDCRNNTSTVSTTNLSLGKNTSGSIPGQIAATHEDPFPMNDSTSQYRWYDNHNVAMTYRCYPSSSCTAQEWAFAVYNNSNDLRGTTLEQEAKSVASTAASQYPAGKCVTESGVQICDLSYNTTGNTGTNRRVKMQGNEIICLDLATGNTTDVKSDTVTINADSQVCASDSGAVYIDPSISVGKHFGGIQRSNSSYTVPNTYTSCIWTYLGGNAAIPYIQTGGVTGPDSSFYGVHAFCQSASNEVDILTTST